MKKKQITRILSASLVAASVFTAAGFPVQAEEHTNKLKLFVDESWWPYQSWEGRIPEMVEDMFDVDIEVTVAADDTAMNMMIASGDMGDLVVSGKFSRLSNSNVCYNLDELAEQAGEELVFDSVTRFVNTANDGNLYTVQCGFSSDYVMSIYDKAVYEGPGMIIRSDIYEAIGSPELATIEDLEAAFDKVKEQYPDVIPFVYNKTHNNNFMKVLCGATTYTSGYVDVDGVAKAFIYDPELKDYYLLMNKWYRAGYMSDENFAFTSEDSDKEYMIAGKVFADAKYSDSVADFTKALTEANSEYEVQAVYEILRTEDSAKFNYSSVGWRGIYIPKSCSNTDLAIKFLNWCYSEEGQHLLLWGEEGTDWNWNEDNSCPIMNYDWDTPSTDDGMKYWGWMCHDGVTNTLPSSASGGTTYEARKALTEITESNPVLAMIRLDPDSEEQTIMDNLTELEANSAVQIITAASEEEAEAAYDEMIATADSLGGEKLTDYATELYTAKKAAYDEIKDNQE